MTGKKKANRSRQAGKAKKGPGTAPVKKAAAKSKGRSAVPASSRPPDSGTVKLVLSYKSLDDPEPSKIATAKQLISQQQQAKILKERAGMLQVSVPSADKDKAQQSLKTLQDWNVSEESVARIRKK